MYQSNSSCLFISLASPVKTDLPELLLLRSNISEDEYLSFVTELISRRSRCRFDTILASIFLIISGSASVAVLALRGLNTFAFLASIVIPISVHVVHRQRKRLLSGQIVALCQKTSLLDSNVVFECVGLQTTTKVYDGTTKSLRDISSQELFIRIYVKST